jgi:hypothetical protein
MHWILSSTALSLTVACGSAQGDQLPAKAGSAGAAGTVAASGSGTNGGSADEGGDAGGSGGRPTGGVGGRATGGASATAGTTGNGGKGGTGAGGATGGAGSLTLACPANPPVHGSSCTPLPEACFYEDCAGVGRTAATCNQGAWAVQTTGCAAVQCDGLSTTCSSGQICSVIQGGAHLAMCTESACGTGPVTCACAGASCANCSISGSPEQGVTVICNTCPQGGCP